MHDVRLPLTSAQSPIYFEQLTLPDSPLYNLLLVADIRGDFKLALFEQALAMAVSKIDVLRSDIEIAGDSGIQHYDKFHNTPLQVLDFLWVEDCDKKLDNWIKQACNTPLQLGSDRLIKFSLIRLPGERNVWVTQVHHIITDGFGFLYLLKQVEAYYKALLNDEDILAMPEPIPFQRYHKQDSAYFQSQQYQKDQAFWQAQISALPDVLIHKQTGEDSNQFRSLRVSKVFSAGQQQSLALFAQQHKVSLAVLHTAVVALYYWKVKNQSRFMMGIPMHRRPKAYRHMMGMFSGVVPCCFDFSEINTLGELFQCVKRTIRVYMPHANMPVTHIQRLVRKYGRDADSFVQVDANYISYDTKLRFTDESAHIAYLKSNSQTNPLEISLCDWGEQQPHVINVDFRLDYYTPEQGQALADRLIHIFHQVSNASPDTAVAAIELVTPDEKFTLSAPSNLPHSHHYAQSVEQLFSARVEMSGEDTAILDGQQKISYQQLNQRAIKLASYLRTRALDSQLVGVCLPQGIEFVTAILAVLKAGFGFVPMDPKLPLIRLRAIQQDAGLSLILHDNEHNDQLAQLDCTTLAITDSNKSQLERMPQSPLVEPTNPAYVLYTSGSTGRPKGVVMGHKALSHHIHHASVEYDYDSKDRILQFASIGCDTAYEQIFTALCNGATLVVRNPTLLSAEQFRDWLLHCEITSIDLPASYAREVLPGLAADEAFWQQSRLSRVILGGEIFPPEIIAIWQHHDRFKQCKLFNAYGPTEACITSHLACLDSIATAELLNNNGSVALGKPVGDSCQYIVNHDLNLVPPGEPGELCIAGTRLADGYLGHKEATDNAFIVPVWSRSSQYRIYRTGDRVKLDRHQQLIFLGRADDQVNIRGFRVELGEIEKVLQSLPEIESAVVLADQRSDAETRLVAYVIAAHAGLSEHRLQQLSATALVEHMQPSCFVLMDAFPVNANGKVDRKSLQLPDTVLEPEQFTPCESATELALAQLWGELLDQQSDDISRNANFFQSGGHSILAIRLCSQIQQMFAVEIGIAEVFELKTLHSIAAYIDELAELQALIALSAAAESDQQQELLERLNQLSEQQLDKYLQLI